MLRYRQMKQINKSTLYTAGIMLAAMLFFYFFNKKNTDEQLSDQKRISDSTIANERMEKAEVQKALMSVRDSVKLVKTQYEDEHNQLENYLKKKNKEHNKNVQVYNHNDSLITDRLKRGMSDIKADKRRHPEL